MKKLWRFLVEAFTYKKRLENYLKIQEENNAKWDKKFTEEHNQLLRDCGLEELIK